VQKGMAIAGRNFAQDVKLDGNADVQVGNQYSEAALRGSGVTDRSDNAAGMRLERWTRAVPPGSRSGAGTACASRAAVARSNTRRQYSRQLVSVFSWPNPMLWNDSDRFGGRIVSVTCRAAVERRRCL
jgi:hypothetical protein